MRRLYPQRILGHWNRYVDGMPVSVLSFLDSVEANIAQLEIRGARLGRVVWPERGLFSPRRYYLQLVYDDVLFLLSAVPIGNGTAFSWWVGLRARGLSGWISELPLVGRLVRATFWPLTFYRIDSMRAIEHVLHAAVLLAIDELTASRGIPRLAAQDRVPIMLDLWRRP